MNTTVKKGKLKAIIIIFVIIIALLTAGAIFLTHEKTDSFYGRTVSLDASSGMTKQQYADDFALLCSQLEDNIPMLYDYEKLYGISYSDIKEYYKNISGNIESDYQYYSLVRSFLNNIPSSHLSEGFPLISSIDEEFKAHIERNKSFVNAQNYWFNVLHNECKKYYDKEINQMIFAYYSGEYRGIAKQIDNDIYNVNKATLLTVNEIPADEFIKLCPSVYKLKYDHINNKPMRDTIIFNDMFGKECVIEYLNSSGEKCSMKAFYGTEADMAAAYINYFKSADGLLTTENTNGSAYSPKTDYTQIGDISFMRNKQNNFLYMQINSFNSSESNGEVMANTIDIASEGIDNIIIDLRNNSGGFYEYASDVLGALSVKDIKIESEVYVTESCCQRYKDKKSYEFDSQSGLYKKCTETIVTGKAKERKNIYLLISDSTASSADMLVYEFKRNGLGTVIGTNNTGGERDGILCMNYTDISGIYYTYTEFSSYNTDGSVNSVYGTAPDIYSDTSIDDYFIREEIKSNGQDPYNWENRLMWDRSLVKVLEIINKNSK